MVCRCKVLFSTSVQTHKHYYISANSHVHPNPVAATQLPSQTSALEAKPADGQASFSLQTSSDDWWVTRKRMKKHASVPDHAKCVCPASLNSIVRSLLHVNLPGREKHSLSWSCLALLLHSSGSMLKKLIPSLCDAKEHRHPFTNFMDFALQSAKVWFYLAANHIKAHFTGWKIRIWQYMEHSFKTFIVEVWFLLGVAFMASLQALGQSPQGPLGFRATFQLAALI